MQAILIGAVLLADVITLKSGGKLEGVVRGTKDGKVSIEVPAGLVAVPEADIAERVEGPSAVSEYYERAERLKGSKDTAALYALAAWARERGMARFATPLLERVIFVDPTHELAHRALGHERVGDQWMPRAEAMKARGYVLFEGRWVTPAERDLVLAEREAKKRLARREVLEEETVVYRTVPWAYGFRPIGEEPPYWWAGYRPWGYGYYGWPYFWPWWGAGTPMPGTTTAGAKPPTSKGVYYLSEYGPYWPRWKK